VDLDFLKKDLKKRTAGKSKCKKIFMIERFIKRGGGSVREGETMKLAL